MNDEQDLDKATAMLNEDEGEKNRRLRLMRLVNRSLRCCVPSMTQKFR